MEWTNEATQSDTNVHVWPAGVIALVGMPNHTYHLFFFQVALNQPSGPLSGKPTNQPTNHTKSERACSTQQQTRPPQLSEEAAA